MKKKKPIPEAGKKVTIPEAAKILGLTPQGVYGLIKILNIEYETEIVKKNVLTSRNQQVVDIDVLRKARDRKTSARKGK